MPKNAAIGPVYNLGRLTYASGSRMLNGPEGSIHLREQVGLLLDAFVRQPRAVPRLTFANAIWQERPEEHTGQALDRVFSDLRKAFKKQGCPELIQRDAAGNYCLTLSPATGTPARSLPDGPREIISLAELLNLIRFAEDGLLRNLSEVYVWCRQPIEARIAGQVLTNMDKGVRYRFIMGIEDLATATSLLVTLAAGSLSEPSAIGQKELLNNLRIVRAGLTILIVPRHSPHSYEVIVNAQDRNDATVYLQLNPNRFVLTGHGPAAHDILDVLQSFKSGTKTHPLQFATTLQDSRLAADTVQENLTRTFAGDSIVLAEITRGLVPKKGAQSSASHSRRKIASS